MPGCYSANAENLDQRGWADSGTYRGCGSEGVGNVNIAVGTHILARLPHTIPKGSTINSATYKLDFGVKDGNVTNTWSAVMRGRNLGNVPTLGHGDPFAGPVTSASASGSFDFAVSATATFDIKNIVQEVVNRSDFVSGGYLAFDTEITAEVGDVNIKLAELFTNPPRINIDYTPPANTTDTEVNVLQHGAFSAFTVGQWGQNAMYGSSTETGTITYDGSFTRNGRGTLKFTTGPFESGKSAGPLISVDARRDEPYIMYGYIYIPSSFTGSVTAQFGFYDLNNAGEITARDQWVPFCTQGTTLDNASIHDGHAYFAWVRVYGNWTEGQSLWLSDVGVMRSRVGSQTPWITGSGSREGVAHTATSNLWGVNYAGQHVRSTRKTATVKESSSVVYRPRYIKTASGLLHRVESFNGSIPVSRLTSTNATFTNNITWNGSGGWTKVDIVSSGGRAIIDIPVNRLVNGKDYVGSVLVGNPTAGSATFTLLWNGVSGSSKSEAVAANSEKIISFNASGMGIYSLTQQQVRLSSTIGAGGTFYLKPSTFNMMRVT